MVIKMKNKNHNFKLYLIILVLVLVGSFLVYRFAFSEDKNTSLVYIGVSDLKTKIRNQETFMLVLSQTGCSHCEQYLPELDRTLQEYDLKAYVLNITNNSDEDNKTLGQIVNFSGTPTTLFFTDGKEKTALNRFVGYVSKAKLVERLQSLGYIK